jgi:hypothetical protein
MPCFRPTPLKRPELSLHIAKARNVVAPTGPKNRGGLPCHAIGEGFPRLLKSSLPACLRSRAKGRSLTRLTMSWRPIRNLSDTVTGKSEHLLRYRNYARSLPNLHRLSCSPCRNAFAPPAHRVGTTSSTLMRSGRQHITSLQRAFAQTGLELRAHAPARSENGRPNFGCRCQKAPETSTRAARAAQP